MKNNKILVVEDDLISAAFLKKLCTREGFEVCGIADNAPDAVKIIRAEKPNLILMDIMIKGPISGCELAMEVRGFDKEVIIIFISAYSSDEMIEYALDSKAYSYLLKPYRDVEIISTIKLALKEEAFKDNTRVEIIECKNGYSYDDGLEKIYHYGKEIFLTQKLSMLFGLLAKNRGASVSYEQIENLLWGERKSINTVRAIAHRLKQELTDLELHSVSKVGYVLY